MAFLRFARVANRAARLAAVLSVALCCSVPLAVAEARTTGARPGATLPVGAGRYVGVPPLRLADTRDSPSQPSYGFTRVDAHTIVIDVAHRVGVPSAATTAVLNVALDGASGPGFVTVFPSGEDRPATSSLNADATGRTIANMVHVKIGTDGAVAIFASMQAGIVVDLVGVYEPVTTSVAEGRLVTISGGATRVFDSRVRHVPMAAKSWRDIDLTSAGVPADAAAAVVSITAISVPIGFWTVYPSGSLFPGTSTLNIDGVGQIRAAQAIVPMHDGAARVRVYSLTGGDFLLDVVGWYTGSSAEVTTDGLFVPTSPVRLFDSREVRAIAPWSGSTYEFVTGRPPFDVSAVALNLTVTDPLSAGYLTAYPAGVSRPDSSNLNFYTWPQTVAGHAIVRVSGRGVAVYLFGGTHVIADLAGWFLGSPTAATLPTPTNPSFEPSAVSALYVPKLNLLVSIQEGSDLDLVANRDVGAVIPGTKAPLAANIEIFGHRTVGRHIFRDLDRLAPGDLFYVFTIDGHVYTYMVMAKNVTPPTYSAIAAVALPYGPSTVQLVACSSITGTPGGTAYRLVVSARLIAAG